MTKLLLPMLAVLLLTACTNHGKKVKSGHIEVFYKDGINEAEAQKTAALIERIDKGAGNDVSIDKSFQLTKSGDTTVLKMVVREEGKKDIQDENFIGLGNIIADSIFNGKPVNIDLTDNKFKSFHLVKYKKIDYSGTEESEEGSGDGFGQKFTVKNVEVFTTGASDGDAKLLGGFLNDYFKPASTYSFQLLKDNAGNYTVKMVANPDKVNTLGKDFFEPLCQGICDKVLSVPAISFELTDEKFNTLRIFNYPADTGDSDRNN